MENIKNNVLIIGLLTLILGLVVGYFLRASTYPPFGMMNGNRIQTKNANNFMGMDSAMREMAIDLSVKTGDALDLAFLDGMIIHHEGAVEMAQTLLKGTSRPELIKLSNDIITAQNGEIEIMKKWRLEWFGR